MAPEGALKGTIGGVAAGDRKGCEGASPKSTQRHVDVPRASFVLEVHSVDHYDGILLSVSAFFGYSSAWLGPFCVGVLC